MSAQRSGESKPLTKREPCKDCDNGNDLLPLEQCDSCGRSEDYCAGSTEEADRG